MTVLSVGGGGTLTVRQIVHAKRAPTTSDKTRPDGLPFQSGDGWADDSGSPSVLYQYVGGGEWALGGNEPATTTSFGTVELATLSELQNGNAPGDQVPTANDVATVIAGVVVGAVPPATTAQQGIVEIATSAEVISPWTSTIPNTAITPANIEGMFASPPPIGVTAQSTGDFTDITASGTLGVTGASTLAALSATTGSFSSTLGVTGASTMASISSTNITASGTLGVTGTSTLAAVNATNGTFSGTLGVTGTMTVADISATNVTLSGTLGVSGASSFSSGTFSTTLGVTGASTLAALSATSGTFSTTLGVTGASTLAALTQVGTANINASGAGVTTIGTGGTGATFIGNATGNTAITGALSTTTTLTGGTGITATTGDIVATAGAVSAGTSVTATTTVTATLGDITSTNGNLVLGTSGNKIISSNVGTTAAAGANSFGSVTLVNGTVTVATTAVTTNSLVMVWRQTIGATGAAALGLISRGTIVNGVSFDINALDPSDATAVIASDVSVCGYMIIN